MDDSLGVGGFQDRRHLQRDVEALAVVELTGDDVTECLGGSHELAAGDLAVARRGLEADREELERARRLAEVQLAERRLFLRYAPCEVVFCLGLTEENELSRILAGAASGPHGSAAVRLGRDLAGGELPLAVVPAGASIPA